MGAGGQITYAVIQWQLQPSLELAKANGQALTLNSKPSQFSPVRYQTQERFRVNMRTRITSDTARSFLHSDSISGRRKGGEKNLWKIEQYSKWMPTNFKPEEIQLVTNHHLLSQFEMRVVGVASYFEKTTQLIWKSSCQNHTLAVCLQAGDTHLPLTSLVWGHPDVALLERIKSP